MVCIDFGLPSLHIHFLFLWSALDLLHPKINRVSKIQQQLFDLFVQLGEILKLKSVWCWSKEAMTMHTFIALVLQTVEEDHRRRRRL